MILIILVLFVFDYLFQKYISKYFVAVFSIELFGQVFDSVIRTIILSMIGITAIYKFKISNQVNDIIDKFISLLKRT